ncbi:MAG: undecaprenyl-diphosphatase UppP [Thermomicrobiales bacterium]|nr:undecaprenyl-diphosphatase UppP [Thermomicrobiales bacterium]
MDADILKAIILGIVQGLTEFLPISSSAHLIIVPWLLGWEPFGLAFDVATHLGTLMAVLVYFRDDLLAMIRGVLAGLPDLRRGRLPDDQMGRIGLFIAVATVPAAIAGFLFESTIDDYFHSDPISGTAMVVLALLLMGMGLLLGIADRVGRQRAGRGLQQVTFRTALLVGFAQMLAIVPGVSRSGSTITAGLFAGLERATAARFSFLLGVPIILGAGLKEMISLAGDGIPAGERGVFIAGVLTAAVVGYFAIAVLIRYLQRHSTDIFVIYRVALGIGLLLLVAGGFRA